MRRGDTHGPYAVVGAKQGDISAATLLQCRDVAGNLGNKQSERILFRTRIERLIIDRVYLMSSSTEGGLFSGNRVWSEVLEKREGFRMQVDVDDRLTRNPFA